MTTTKKFVYRDAGTGRFVTQREAEKKPKTTVAEKRSITRDGHPPPRPLPGIKKKA